MFTERFITYFAYYTIPLLWGLYLKWFLFPAVTLGIVWHYWLYGLCIRTTSDGADRLASLEYSLWLPMTGAFALYIGWSMSKVWNFNRMLFTKKFDEHLCWVLVAALNFVSFHAAVGIWEFGGRLDPPIKYWVTFAVQVVLLAVWGFVNSRFDVFWMHKSIDAKGIVYLSDRDNKFTKFTVAHVVLTVSTTVIFAIIRGVAPDFWPFWISLITFGFHLILVLISKGWTRKRLGHHPGALFEALASSYDNARSASATAMGMPADSFASAPSSSSATTTRRVSASESGGAMGNAMEMEPLTGSNGDRSDIEEGAKKR
jgi:hypothetical protein